MRIGMLVGINQALPADAPHDQAYLSSIGFAQNTNVNLTCNQHPSSQLTIHISRFSLHLASKAGKIAMYAN